MLLVLLSIAFQALSLLVLGGGAWLLWSWNTGAVVGTAYLVASLALLAWSLLGRLLILPLLGRRGQDDPREERGSDAVRVQREDGADLHVERYGPEDGVPIVLTHGWGQNSAEWHYARRELGDRFPTNPVGTGAMRFVEYRPGQHVVMQSHPGYWGKKPAFSQMRFRFIPENGTRLAALEAVALAPGLGRVHPLVEPLAPTPERLIEGRLRPGNEPVERGRDVEHDLAHQAGSATGSSSGAVSACSAGIAWSADSRARSGPGPRARAPARCRWLRRAVSSRPSVSCGVQRLSSLFADWAKS